MMAQTPGSAMKKAKIEEAPVKQSKAGINLTGIDHTMSVPGAVLGNIFGFINVIGLGLRRKTITARYGDNDFMAIERVCRRWKIVLPYHTNTLSIRIADIESYITDRSPPTVSRFYVSLVDRVGSFRSLKHLVVDCKSAAIAVMLMMRVSSFPLVSLVVRLGGTISSPILQTQIRCLLLSFAAKARYIACYNLPIMMTMTSYNRTRDVYTSLSSDIVPSKRGQVMINDGWKEIASLLYRQDHVAFLNKLPVIKCVKCDKISVCPSPCDAPTCKIRHKIKLGFECSDAVTCIVHDKLVHYNPLVIPHGSCTDLIKCGYCPIDADHTINNNIGWRIKCKHPLCGGACTKCGTVVCNIHGKACTICDKKLYCISHVIQCKKCHKYVCHDHHGTMNGDLHCIACIGSV